MVNKRNLNLLKILAMAISGLSFVGIFFIDKFWFPIVLTILGIILLIKLNKK